MKTKSDIKPLASPDRAAWEILARGYRDFYKTPTSDEEYAETWDRLMRNDGIHGLGAVVDGELLGIAHFLYHTTVWSPRACYLQDLFTAPHARGRGIARQLIESVAQDARSKGADRYYWLTQDDNATARVLYDKVANFSGFLRYEHPLQVG